MDRRTFIGTLAGGLLVPPLTAEAQQARKPYRVGLLETPFLATNAANVNAFRQGLRELGYAETQHYVIEYRSADGQDARFPELAAELTRPSSSIPNRPGVSSFAPSPPPRPTPARRSSASAPSR